MPEFLIAHSAVIFSYGLQAGLAAAFVCESLAPRRPLLTARVPRWWQQLALLALGSLLTRLCLPLAALPVAHWGQTQHWGLFNHDNLPPWLSLPAEVLVIDFWVYAQHRVWHAIPILWRFHQIHHSDQEVDSGTSIRHHPVEALLTQTFYLALILVFGIAPIAVFTATAIALIHEIFAHANLSLPQKVDRMLRWLLVTPDMHRIHHSAESAESNRNFASIFPWWDRMCSTYLDAPAHGHTAMTLGLSYLRDSGQLSLWKLLSLPLQRPSVAPGRKATATENVPIPL